MIRYFWIFTLLIFFPLHASAQTSDLGSLQAKAERGNEPAQGKLCYIYYEGLPGTGKDYAAAAKWCGKFVDSQKHGLKGNDDGVVLYRLAQIYAEGGHGLKQDVREAEKWHRQLADRGNVTSALWLGNLYMDGETALPPNWVEAVKWYRMAATRGGDQEAELKLGRMYASGGHGLEKNYKEGYVWLSLAIRPDNDKALSPEVADIATHLTPDEIQNAKDEKATVLSARPVSTWEKCSIFLFFDLIAAIFVGIPLGVISLVLNKKSKGAPEKTAVVMQRAAYTLGIIAMIPVGIIAPIVPLALIALAIGW